MKQIRAALLPVTLCSMFLFSSCSVVQEISQGMMNLSRCTFKLDGIADFRLAGVSLAGKTRLSPLDGARAAAAFAQGALPASFTLNVAARNPATGTAQGGRGTATMTRLSWSLFIDNVRTIDGEVTKPIEIPGTGEQTIIPLRMNLDLVQFFQEKGFDRILNLALALGGTQGSASRVTLRARPTISTSFGPISYPGEIEIVDTEFRGE